MNTHVQHVSTLQMQSLEGDVWVVLNGRLLNVSIYEDVDSSEAGYTMKEVAKHNKKCVVWVVLSSIGTQVG